MAVIPFIRRHPAATAMILLMALAMTSCWIFRRPWFLGNLGEVDAGRVIRSAQPTTQLPALIRDYRLRSILNLRGALPRTGGMTPK